MAKNYSKNSIKLLIITLVSVVNIGHSQTDTTATAEDSVINLIPVISNLDEVDNGAQSQDIAGILQSSRDIFTNTAGFTFGAARFKIRGYESDFTTTMINGIPMSDLESGWGTWYRWGGLNDVTRYSTVQTGIGANDYTFGNLGGNTNVNMRATHMRRGTRISYAYTNRAYRHRVMASYSTGLMENGWAFAVSASGRFAEEGYVDGTFYRATSYFLSIQKQINEKHSLNLAVYGAPNVVGRQSLSQQEAYDLTGDNYYNSYWGYQTDPETGEKVKRNSRVRNSHLPMAILTYDFDFKNENKTKLTANVFGSYGRSGQTRLNWYDAKDPRPDYYRYLPSYNQQDYPLIANQQTLAWQNDPTQSQLDWDGLYNANYKNLYTVDNVNGTENTLTGLRSKYILQEDRKDELYTGGNVIFNHNFTERLSIVAGLNILHQDKHYFQVVDDLLGGEYWLNIDQFAERDIADPNASQNDLENPNQIVKEGDKFGYDYNIVTQTNQLFAQVEYKFPKIEIYAGAEFSNSNFWRVGNVANGRFPETSKGKSEVHSFFNYSVKLGAEYKVSGRHYITLNAAAMTRAPRARDVFISPRTRPNTINGLENEFVYSTDLSYHVRYAKVKVRLTGYFTEIKNQIWSRSFYHDDFNNFINYQMTGVDQRNMGLELGTEVEIWNGISFVGVAALGSYFYTSRPQATISVDNSSELLAEDRTVYLKNYHVGGMPQSAFSAGIKYFGSNYWFAGVNFNYFMDIYLDPNPDRRTEEAVANFIESDPQWGETLDQTKLDDGFTLNAYVGKSFKIKSKYFLSINFNATNILNNKTFTTGGYEQLRYDSQNIDKFPPKLAYMYGFNFFAMVTFRF